ncbi:MAG: hypothetical protein IKT23_00010 [Clostridia bacterium]|nr:hypothetical protein [Clostridia bacterium]MBR6498053.1 hypothetical protein [Clostridia bacterium]
MLSTSFFGLLLCGTFAVRTYAGREVDEVRFVNLACLLAATFLPDLPMFARATECVFPDVAAFVFA